MMKRTVYTKLLVTSTIFLLLNFLSIADGQGQNPGIDRCDLDLTLRFPKKRTPDHVDAFYSSDTMLIKKTNRDGKPFSDNDVCSSFNQETGWGCKHEGEAFVDFNLQVAPDQPRNQYGEENAHIEFAAGRRFLVQVRHQFTDRETHQSPPNAESSDMRSRLFVKVNGRMIKKRAFKPRKNIGIPTHVVEEVFAPFDGNIPTNDLDQSGFINPKYKGTYFVSVNCDKKCDCTLKKQAAPKTKCEVTAKLVPTHISTFDRSESLTVRKEGSSVPPCSINDSESWFCAHYGDAKIFEKTRLQAEAVKISDASASSYIFNISKELKESSLENMSPFGFYIFTPRQTFGPLSPKIDATFYVKAWGLNCNRNCNCDEPFELPSIY